MGRVGGEGGETPESGDPDLSPVILQEAQPRALHPIEHQMCMQNDQAERVAAGNPVCGFSLNSFLRRTYHLWDESPEF